ncbi:hypothetical protein ACFVS2_25345 [Brevibacillus sp. NPDC058079]|uniref:hypothetical protein n=1 Tax=Brevibacillus sp. NPDC058079 TaxID=3346330 RepID=UPI0036E810E6
MKKILASELLKATIESAEERSGMYPKPLIVQVAMLVDLDEHGRIRGYSPPSIDNVLFNQFVDDSKWPFKSGQQVYHRTLKQVGTFIEVDQLDPTSASVEFTEEDGFKEEKRVSLVLLTDQIPQKEIHINVTVNNIIFTVFDRISGDQLLTHVIAEDTNIDARVSGRLTVSGRGAVKYKSEILTAVSMYDDLKREQEK